jgi:O-antigen/teichoic acid export membrane protein
MTELNKVRKGANLLGQTWLKESTLILIASILANGLNYLFNFCTNRLLPPQEYGALSSLLALFMILAIPSTSASAVTVQYVSRFHAQGAPDDAGALFLRLLRYLGGYGLVLLIGLGLLAGVIAKFLQLPSHWPVIALATALLPSVMLPVAQGGLQGIQRFWALSGTMLLGSSVRLLAGVLLIWLGWGVSGALVASTFAGLFALTGAMWILRPIWQSAGWNSSSSDQGVLQYATTAFWGILAFTVLTNVDVILVKHFFMPKEAGFYATASTLSRIILYLPTAVSTVLFPKAAERHAREEDSSGLARESLLLAIFLCLPLVTFYFAFPKFILRLLFGTQYLPSAPIIGPLGLIMFFFAMVGFLLQYYLSVRDHRFVIIVGLGAVGAIVGLYAFHGSPSHVLMVLGGVGLGILLVGEGWCRGLLRGRKP